MKKFLPLIAVGIGLLGSAFLTSCQTAEGFGRDLQIVGRQLEEEAHETYHGY